MWRAQGALRPAALAVLLLAASAPDAAGFQRSPTVATVQGTVRDDLDRGIVGALVAVIGNASSAETTDGGRFSLRGIPDGQWLIHVRRLGYSPETLRVTIAEGAAPVVDLVVRQLALALAPVQVIGRRELRGVLAGFYDRVERGQGGRFLTREQIVQRAPARMSDLLRGIPGVRVESRRGGTASVRVRGTAFAPTIYLNGVPLVPGDTDLDALDPLSFEGIEVYSGAATVPLEFMGGRGSATTGTVIVLWTREGQSQPRRSRRGSQSAARRIETLIQEGRVFRAGQVEAVARVREAESIKPVYPDSLFRHRVPGQVVVEFVVDSLGDVQMETFGTVWSTHPLLGDAVRRAIEGQQFIPARRGGRAVAQLVQQPFDFVPDSTAGERKPEE